MTAFIIKWRVVIATLFAAACIALATQANNVSNCCGSLNESVREFDACIKKTSSPLEQRQRIDSLYNLGYHDGASIITQLQWIGVLSEVERTKSDLPPTMLLWLAIYSQGLFDGRFQKPNIVQKLRTQWI